MGFVLFSRPGCCLCEDLLAELTAELASIPAAQGVPLEVRDVDASPETRIRYGHKVPVLLFRGELVCHGRLDREELHKVFGLPR